VGGRGVVVPGGSVVVREGGVVGDGGGPSSWGNAQSCPVKGGHQE